MYQADLETLIVVCLKETQQLDSNRAKLANKMLSVKMSSQKTLMTIRKPVIETIQSNMSVSAQLLSVCIIDCLLRVNSINKNIAVSNCLKNCYAHENAPSRDM